MIRLTFNQTDQRTVAALRDKGNVLIPALARKLSSLMIRLQAKIVGEKLSGQVLSHRSGVLAGSVEAHPATSQGSALVATVTAGGGAAHAYAGVHERGGEGEYEIRPVNKKALAFFPSGSLGAGGGIVQVNKAVIQRIFTGKGTIKATAAARAQFSKFGGIVVKSVNHPPLAARPYMQPSLDEFRETIVTELQQTVSSILSGANISEAGA